MHQSGGSGCSDATIGVSAGGGGGYYGGGAGYVYLKLKETSFKTSSPFQTLITPSEYSTFHAVPSDQTMSTEEEEVGLVMEGVATSEPT